MPTKITLNSKGLEELKQIQANFIERLGNALVEEAQLRSPVDTGNLRDSIEIKQIEAKEVLVGSSVPYAIFVELGTSKQPAHPFLRPSLDYTINNISDLEE